MRRAWPVSTFAVIQMVAFIEDSSQQLRSGGLSGYRDIQSAASCRRDRGTFRSPLASIKQNLVYRLKLVGVGIAAAEVCRKVGAAGQRVV